MPRARADRVPRRTIRRTGRRPARRALAGGDDEVALAHQHVAADQHWTKATTAPMIMRWFRLVEKPMW